MPPCVHLATRFVDRENFSACFASRARDLDFVMDFSGREDAVAASFFLTRFIADACAFVKVLGVPLACFSASLADALWVDAAGLADCLAADLTLALLCLACGAEGFALSCCCTTGRCFPLATGAAIVATAKVMLPHIKTTDNKADPNFERTMRSPSWRKAL